MCNIISAMTSQASHITRKAPSVMASFQDKTENEIKWDPWTQII